MDEMVILNTLFIGFHTALSPEIFLYGRTSALKYLSFLSVDENQYLYKEICRNDFHNPIILC